MIRIVIFSLAFFATLFGIGCSVFGYIGAGKQAMEDQMLIEKPAEYDLEGKRVAVVIDTDLSIHYEHPGISTSIAGGVAARVRAGQSGGRSRCAEPGTRKLNGKDRREPW